MKCFVNDHCGGMIAVPKEQQDEIVAAIVSVNVMPARMMATVFRDDLSRCLYTSGWSTKMPISKDSGISISSMKGTTGLCMQTGGNMARMYADWLKLQHLYVTGKISCGVMIVPSKPTAQLLGDNIVHATRLIQELALFSRVIHIPMIIYSFE